MHLPPSDPTQSDLARFNEAPATEAAELVRACADVDHWVDALVARRPFPSVAALLTAADGLATTWDAADLASALADHPRIGERHGSAGSSAAMSGAEQAGVDVSAADVAARLAAGNARYEERFDRIFLVRAAGRSAEEVLDILDERLQHDPETEVAVTLGQLREIAALRLEGSFT